MKHNLTNVTKETNFSHVNLFLANYETHNGNFSYQVVSRRQKENLAIISKNHNFVDAVKILPYTKINGRLYIVFIKEFRYALNDYIYSVPAGLVEQNEDPTTSVKRELMEEIGAKVVNLTLTEPCSYITEGMSDETLTCYEAEVELVSAPTLDGKEDIEVKLVEISSVEEFLQNNLVNLQTRLMAKNFLLTLRLNSPFR